METYLAYFDETGDDGMVKYSCDHFVLTSVYMPIASWQTNFDAFRAIGAVRVVSSLMGRVG